MISFIDGRPYKTLTRHLTGNGMTIEQYRQRSGLPREDSTTTSHYSAMRRECARNAALGNKRRARASTRYSDADTLAAASCGSNHNPELDSARRGRRVGAG
ncbi:MucR family transcriptional regulator, partial [Methylobacterium radiotolerans]|uniref:MucR family transcriptional regulator n=1 Tax=Methylobacterium radiotolerans TaxID=31998 RepID=UPI003F672B45